MGERRRPCGDSRHLTHPPLYNQKAFHMRELHYRSIIEDGKEGVIIEWRDYIFYIWEDGKVESVQEMRGH